MKKDRNRGFADLDSQNHVKREPRMYGEVNCLSQGKNVFLMKCGDGGYCVKKVYHDACVYDLYVKISAIHHLMIPEIYDIVQEGDTVTVYEEYIAGENLAQRIRRTLCTEEETVNILHQLILVLSVLHKHGIIYRDLKPSNILYTPNRSIKLIDFGASRFHVKGKEHDTRKLGTIGYAPPEQYGFSQTDERSDIYTLGIVLFELLTGTTTVDFSIYNGKLMPIIKKCTQFSPEMRYQRLEELERDIFKILFGRRVSLIHLVMNSIKYIFFVMLWFVSIYKFSASAEMGQCWRILQILLAFVTHGLFICGLIHHSKILNAKQTRSKDKLRVCFIILISYVILFVVIFIL